MRITLDSGELDRMLRTHPDGVVRPAARMGLNDAGRQGHVAGRQEIYKKWNLTAGFIAERVKISSFARNDELTLVIQATGRPIDLTHFGARWVKGNRIVKREGSALGVRTLKRSKSTGGVFYQVHRKATGGATNEGHLPSAFIARVKAGKTDSHVGVFVRAGKARLKIIKKVLISVPSMFEQEPVYEAIRRTVEAKFPERFQHHIDRLMGSA